MDGPTEQLRPPGDDGPRSARVGLTSPTWLLAAVALVVALAAGAAGTDELPAASAAPEPPPPLVPPSASVGPLPGLLPRTWSEPCAQTTCGEWAGSMTELQQIAAAAELLVAARQAPGLPDLPSPALVFHFAGAVDGRCKAGPGEAGIVQAAAEVFADDADDADDEGRARQWQS